MTLHGNAKMQGNLVEDDDWGKNVVEMPTGMAKKKNKKRVQLSKYDIALFIKDMTDIHLVSAFIPVCCMGCIQWNGMGWFGLGKEWIHMWIIPVCRLVGRLFLTVSTSNQLTMYKFLYGAEIKVFLKSVHMTLRLSSCM